MVVNRGGPRAASSHNVLQVYQLAIRKNRVLASRSRSANAPLRVAVLQRAHWESLRRHSDARRSLADRTLRRRSPLHVLNTGGEEPRATHVTMCATTAPETTEVGGGCLTIVEVSTTGATTTTTTTGGPLTTPSSQSSEDASSQSTKICSRGDIVTSWSGEHAIAEHPNRRTSDVEYTSCASEEHHLDLSNVEW
jgi:hypothetical protein